MPDIHRYSVHPPSALRRRARTAFVLAAGFLLAGVVLINAFRSSSPAGHPPAQGTTMTVGASVYLAKCAVCHGSEGRGDGPAATALDPRPRDFTRGVYKFRSTLSGSLPTDEDLRHTIMEGLHGTAMPDWKEFLHGDTLDAIVAHIKSFSPRFSSEVPQPITPGPATPPTAANIAAGEQVYARLQCGACHGERGDLAGAVSSEMTDDWNNPLRAANLTEPWTFKGGSSARDIYLRFITGIDGAPMPSYSGTATDQEMWNLAHYIVSMGRKPAWEMTDTELMAFFEQQDRSHKENPVERGRYLVETRGCVSCHTPVHADGSLIDELRLAGGQKTDLYPFGTYVTYNLTPDPETGLGMWTDEEIKKAITHGLTRDGWRMLPFPMPWTSYAQMSETDLNAIIAYLRTIPAVKNKVPPPEHPNIFSYLWGKFQMLILRKQAPGHIYPGNAGDAVVQDHHAADHPVAQKEVQP